MSEYILPQSVTPISGMATPAVPSDTATDQPTAPHKCDLLRDAWRGALTDLKRAVRLVEERHRAYDECMASTATPTAYSRASAVRVEVCNIMVAIEAIGIATGIKIE